MEWTSLGVELVAHLPAGMIRGNQWGTKGTRRQSEATTLTTRSASMRMVTSCGSASRDHMREGRSKSFCLRKLLLTKVACLFPEIALPLCQTL